MCLKWFYSSLAQDVLQVIKRGNPPALRGKSKWRTSYGNSLHIVAVVGSIVGVALAGLSIPFSYWYHQGYYKQVRTASHDIRCAVCYGVIEEVWLRTSGQRSRSPALTSGNVEEALDDMCQESFVKHHAVHFDPIHQRHIYFWHNGTSNATANGWTDLAIRAACRKIVQTDENQIVSTLLQATLRCCQQSGRSPSPQSSRIQMHTLQNNLCNQTSHCGYIARGQSRGDEL